MDKVVRQVKYKTREVPIGNLKMGGNNPILVQSMWDRAIPEDFHSVEASLLDLKERGCDVMRFAVPNQDQAKLLGRLARVSSMPLVADIHFDYRLALKVMDYPIAKIRINPGNIGASWKVEEVVRKASDKGIALRVGANEGSLPRALRSHEDRAEAMIIAVEEQLGILEKLGFKDVVVSLKSSSYRRCIEANRLFAAKYDNPLHLGVTEAGPLIPSLIKTSLALGPLLREGIGHTLRFSISDSPGKEVQAARELLSQLGLDSRPHVELISCPKCGRTSFDTHSFTQEIQPHLERLNKDLTLAIMGCEVNGPGEASHADLGISGSGKGVAIFRRGKIIRKGELWEAKEIFLEELEKL